MKKTAKILLLSLFLLANVKNINVSNDSLVNNEKITTAEKVVAVSIVSEVANLEIQAKSAYLMDYGTQTAVYKKDEDKRLPIASMCKIMTLILSFEAVDKGIISMNEEICISEKAASMGGSQVFLEANAKYPVHELIKSIVVCSANDSCVALAEQIAGNESLFVDKMNEKANELGLSNTLFANCTGLPKEPQYSSAKDVAIMLKTLLSHEEYYQFSNVWLEKFAHPKGRYTEITNTNKLVRFYDGCDGGKTGFTNEAGFCLAATAKRNDLRMISVVIGEESSAKRFEDIRTMFDYAFANYSALPILEKDVPLNENPKVDNGKEKNISVVPEKSCYAFISKGEKNNCAIDFKWNKLRAPIKKGEKVGEALIFKDGVEIERVALLCNIEIQKANFFDRLQDIAEEWTH